MSERASLVVVDAGGLVVVLARKGSETYVMYKYIYIYIYVLA